MAIKLLSAGGGSVTLDVPSTAANVAINVPAGNATLITSNDQLSFRNRIINGDMRIDQRNAGAAVTVTTAGGGFAVDRFPTFNQCDGGVSAQQITDAPSGFNNSLRVTITTADGSLDPIQYVEVRQPVEGFNVADLAWGTAAAQTVTLSFWVKSSLTGTFGGSFMNSNVNRAYPFSYTIASSGTWEFKTITVSGDTAGTWEKTNGNGMFVILNLGAGSDFQGVADNWVAARKHTVNGAVNLAATNGATWQVTGVQLEAGSVATPFERRPFGAELALCQRYFERMGGTRYEQIGFGAGTSGTATRINIHLKTEKRASPTFTITQDVIITPRHEYDTPVTGTGSVNINPRGMHARFDHADLGALYRPHFLLSNANAPFGYLDFNAEL